MKLLTCVLFIICSLNLYPQTNDSLDFKENIKRIVNDSTSEFYYPKLIEQMKKHPAEMSTQEYYYLYYGQIFQKGHKILSFIANPERGPFDQAVYKGKCKKALGFGLTILDRNPVELTVLLHLSNCMNESGNADTTYFFQQRFMSLLGAIFSTGDGKSLETAIKIVNMEDDYILKGVLGFLGGEEQLEFENNRAYSVWTKDGNKLYFEDVINVDR